MPKGCQNPEKIAELGPVPLLRMRDCGMRSARVIAQLLHELGHIKGVEDWLSRAVTEHVHCPCCGKSFFFWR